MIIQLSAMRSDRAVTYQRDGDTLLIDGEPVDLSGDWAELRSESEGEPLEPSGNLLAGVRDESGQVTLTARAPHRANAPVSERFPEPVALGDGEAVTFPREAIEDD